MSQPQDSGSTPEPRADPRARNYSDTALAMPTFARFRQLFGRFCLLRCPNCGRGPVLTKWKTDVRKRCTSCNFRYMRSDDNYFSGAMFFSLMIMEGIFAFSMVAYLILVWPNVHWDALTYVAAGGMVILAFIMQPLGKHFWLTLDVLIRPISKDECE